MWKPIPEINDEEIRAFEKEFRKKAKFLVDENMGVEVSDLLREFGYNSKYVGEVDLLGHPDENLYAYAWKHERIIITHDNDFMDNTRFPFNRNPGVIVLPGANGNGTLEHALADMLRIMAPYGDAHKGVKIEVTENRVWTIYGFSKEEGRHIKKKVQLGNRGEAFEWQG